MGSGYVMFPISSSFLLQMQYLYKKGLLESLYWRGMSRYNNRGGKDKDENVFLVSMSVFVSGWMIANITIQIRHHYRRAWVC